MKHCTQETAVARAIRFDRWDNELEAHVSGCASCSEVVQAARWMQALAPPEGLSVAGSAALPAVGIRSGDAPMPEATLLWCRALLDQKEAEARGGRQRMMAMEIASAALMTLLLAGWLSWNWPAITASISGVPDALLPKMIRALAWFLLPAGSDAISVTTILALALGGAAVLLSYPLLSEE